MSQEKTEAIMLRGIDFSETSRIVTFLCPDRGRLTCMARGVKRPKSQLAALLETFNRLEVVYHWKESRAVQQLSDASVLDGFAGIKGDLDKVTYAALPLEMAGKAVHDNEPSHEIYATLVQGLEGLAQWTGGVRVHIAWQMLGLLRAAGFEPSLDACVDCGQPVGPAPVFAYRGGVACSACRGDVKLSAQGYETLRALAASSEGCPDTAADGAEVFRLLHAFAARQFETSFRSVRVIHQMFG